MLGPPAVVPESGAALTPAWFNAALRAPTSGTLARDVALERLGGLSSLTFRARLAYHTPGAAGAPPSVIVKLGSAPRVGGLGFDREVRFYEEIAPSLPVAVPSVLHAHVDSGAGRFVLLLEDLMARGNVRPFASGDLQSGVEAIARLHARWWDSPRVERYGFLRSMDEFIDRVGGLLSEGLPLWLERFGALSGPSERQAIARLPAGFRNAAAPLVHAPATLAHHDLSRRNLFIQDEHGRREVVFIDWQLVNRVPGVRDLSFFIQNEGGGLTGDGEGALLRRYFDTLAAHGIDGYSFEQLQEDYRRSIICDLARMVMTGSNPDLAAAMRDIVVEQIANRSGSVERWGLLELL